MDMQKRLYKIFDKLSSEKRDMIFNKLYALYIAPNFMYESDLYKSGIVLRLNTLSLFD